MSVGYRITEYSRGVFHGGQHLHWSCNHNSPLTSRLNSDFCCLCCSHVFGNPWRSTGDVHFCSRSLGLFQVIKLAFFGGRVEIRKYLVTGVSTNLCACVRDLQVRELLPVEGVVDKRFFLYHAAEVVAHEHSAWLCLPHDQVRNQHVLSKDVISDDLCADDASNDLACVQPHLDVELAQSGVLEPVSFLPHHLTHVLRELEHVVGFPHEVFRGALHSSHFTAVAHHNVRGA